MSEQSTFDFVITKHLAEKTPHIESREKEDILYQLSSNNNKVVPQLLDAFEKTCLSASRKEIVTLLASAKFVTKEEVEKLQIIIYQQISHADFFWQKLLELYLKNSDEQFIIQTIEFAIWLSIGFESAQNEVYKLLYKLIKESSTNDKIKDNFNHDEFYWQIPSLHKMLDQMINQVFQCKRQYKENNWTQLERAISLMTRNEDPTHLPKIESTLEAIRNSTITLYATSGPLKHSAKMAYQTKLLEKTIVELKQRKLQQQNFNSNPEVKKLPQQIENILRNSWQVKANVTLEYPKQVRCGNSYTIKITIEPTSTIDEDTIRQISDKLSICLKAPGGLEQSFYFRKDVSSSNLICSIPLSASESQMKKLKLYPTNQFHQTTCIYIEHL